MAESEEQKASPGQRRRLATRLPECLALQLPRDEWTTSNPFKHHPTCHPANIPKYLLCVRPPVRLETYTDEKDKEGHDIPGGHLLKAETRIQRNNLKITIISNNSCQEGC